MKAHYTPSLSLRLLPVVLVPVLLATQGQLASAFPLLSPTAALSARSTQTTIPSFFQLYTANDTNEMDLQAMLQQEAKEIQICSKLLFETYSKSKKDIDVTDVVNVCDSLEALTIDDRLWTSKVFQLRQRTLEHRRYEWLAKLLQKDYEAYVATASFLSPTRIPRNQLPNVQDVPLAKGVPVGSKQFNLDGQLVVQDCQLDDMKYNDNLLDKLLLNIFRTLVTENTGGVTSSKEGILGLVEQGRTFLLQPGQTPEAQHKMVRDTLAGLMTPFLPPFYRIFMAGKIPGTNTQLGPWFYAPFLTSFVTPTFFGFLVGPSYPNRRKDGKLGGLVVEKCKFLQESGCKGLCLHQCKLPAQQFFQEELGLALTVSPNFVTQECQWSFGEIPFPPAQDPSFPQGCLAGCESRRAIIQSGSQNADICN
jgi:Beta-carotene isomerase D27-like, C-terminal